MRVNSGNDLSFLFSGSMKSSSTSSMYGINFGDYASIKNGSYGKLMKAYYGKSNSAVNSITGDKSLAIDKETKKELTTIQADSDSLKDSADALLAKGNDSLFAKKDITTTNEDGTTTKSYGYDVQAISKGVKEFIKDYNSMIKSGSDTQSDSIANQTKHMIGSTAAYEKSLAKIGITIGKDNQLTLNEDTFKKSSMESVKSLFNNTASYGYTVSSKASQINFSADRELSKAQSYNSYGNYNNAYNIGNLYNSYF